MAMTNYHLCLDVRGALHNWADRQRKAKALDVLEKLYGEPHLTHWGPGGSCGVILDDGRKFFAPTLLEVCEAIEQAQAEEKR